MSGEPQYRVVSDSGGAIETLATVRTDAAAIVEFAGLRQALREHRPEIIVTPPAWLPSALFFLFLIAVLFELAIDGVLSRQGLRDGYNVERCLKVKVKDIELSSCLKLTKP